MDTSVFVRFYAFVSQIVDYNEKDLEKLSQYACKLHSILGENFDGDDPIDLSHDRLFKQLQ